jgi:hypothetical protein
MATLGRRIHESEHVVKHIVTALAVRQQLEALRVAHGLLLGIDLNGTNALSSALKTYSPRWVLTKSWPVTRTMMPPVVLEGWASSVAT